MLVIRNPPKDGGRGDQIASADLKSTVDLNVFSDSKLECRSIKGFKVKKMILTKILESSRILS